MERREDGGVGGGGEASARAGGHGVNSRRYRNLPINDSHADTLLRH